MPINDKVSFTWLGHGTWRIRSAKGKEILVDPWLSSPTIPENLKHVDHCDILVLTHGHFDHTADALEIAKRLKPAIVTTFEIANWFERNGVEGAIGGLQGGTIEVAGISFLLVHAEHSSSFGDGSYAGNPVGYVIEFENGFKIYYSGDTDVFADMALIRELEQPEVAFLCIGDFFTMGPKRAAKAVELLGTKTVVPMHFATFPQLVGRPSQLQELVPKGVKVLDIKPGDQV
ncbi:MAG TPA: metal-dependent hydrolase [Candidatus Acidoferrales bacterium]|nr:metal-dependent hydrolase [Candidatus Acidoferrales bacterium]